MLLAVRSHASGARPQGGIADLFGQVVVELGRLGLVLLANALHPRPRGRVPAVLAEELARVPVAAEAHRLEHAITPTLLTNIVGKLGNPKMSPYGRPIPGSGHSELPPKFAYTQIKLSWLY